MPTAILIPVELDDPIRPYPVPDTDALEVLQELVGGCVESVPWNDRPDVTSYVHDEGKYMCQRNERATALMVGTGRLFTGDWIAGPYVVIGFDPRSGKHRDVPFGVAKELLEDGPSHFELQVELGNAAVQDLDDVAGLLDGLATALRYTTATSGTAADTNGNTVLTWELT